MQGQWPLVLDHYLLIPPVPYSQPIERGHVSEGGLSDIDSQRAVFQGGMQMLRHHVDLNETTYLPSGGIEYCPVVLESDRLSTYTGLDDYYTLFAKLDMVEEH